MSRCALVLIVISLLWVSGCAAPRRTMITAPPPAGSLSHTVQKGQTLYRIAKQYDVDVSELMRVNGIYNPSQVASGQKIWIPRKRVEAAAKPSFTLPWYKPKAVDVEEVRRILGPKRYAYKWYTITLHHSATSKGGAKAFDKDHRRRKMGGLFYHFVIGNGSYSGDGEIEVGWRWRRQVKANRPNDIQICLVGDFSKRNVSSAQKESLLNLLVVLTDDYSIPASKVRQHGDVKGKHTECPGRKFPYRELVNKLKNRER